MTNTKKTTFVFAASVSIACGMALLSSAVQAGGFIFNRNLPDSVTFPAGYTGAGGQVDVKVCIVPGTQFADEMTRPVQNNIAVWNKLQSTSSNLRTSLPANTNDFESVSLHEIGHCIGLDHPNLGAIPGVGQGQTNYSSSTRGPDNQYNFNAGPDGLIGSGDDIRGDDVSLNYFYPDSNNPFVEKAVVDSSTYSRDVASLPFGDTFAANADRELAATPRYSVPNTEGVMQQGTFGNEVQRTLSHDDVSTVRYAMSGVDAIDSTDDDYTVNLTYGGISSDADCDINISMNSSQTGFAVCVVGATNGGVGDNFVITQGNIFFEPNIDWYFNDQPPCSESIPFEANVWQMISLPCQVGISSPGTVRAVFADDLGEAAHEAGTWAMFTYEYTEQADGTMAPGYRRMTLDDELDSSKGYWVLTRSAGLVVDVQGEYNGQMDTELHVDSAAGSSYGWNLVGMPHRFPVTWADAIAIDPVGNLLSLAESDPADPVVTGGTACTERAEPSTDCKVAHFAFSFNSAIEDYNPALTLSSGSVNKFEATWVFAGDTGYKLRFPMTEVDRTSP
ncbi:MAG: hypothetical protein AB8B64_19080 [Granulosicoccus sp.]